MSCNRLSFLWFTLETDVEVNEGFAGDRLFTTRYLRLADLVINLTELFPRWDFFPAFRLDPRRRITYYLSVNLV